jgi:hypothetical protein
MNYPALALVFMINVTCTSPANTDDSVVSQRLQETGALVGKELDSFNEYVKLDDYVEDLVFRIAGKAQCDLDNDLIPDTLTFWDIELIRFKNGKSQAADEPGDFLFLTIALTNKMSKDTFLLKDGWVKRHFLKEIEMDKPRFNSNFIELYQGGKNNLLILEGYVYGDGGTTQTVINVYDGRPTLIFNDDQRIKSVVTNSNGKIEMATTKRKTETGYSGEIMYYIDNWLHPKE